VRLPPIPIDGVPARRLPDIQLVLIQPATRVRFDRGNSSFNIRLAYYAGFESPCRGGAFIASKNLLTSA